MHMVKKLLLVFFIIVLAISAVLLTTCAYDCPTCKDDKKIDCEDCDGKGRVPCTKCDGDGIVPCSRCDGKGEIALICDRCNGFGYMYEVNLQSGIAKRDCSLCENGTISKDCPPSSSCGCRNGKRDCETCAGEGKVKCPDCWKYQ